MAGKSMQWMLPRGLAAAFEPLDLAELATGWLDEQLAEKLERFHFVVVRLGDAEGDAVGDALTKELRKFTNDRLERSSDERAPRNRIESPACCNWACLQWSFMYFK